MRQCALLTHTEKLAELAQELNPNGPTTAGASQVLRKARAGCRLANDA